MDKKRIPSLRFERLFEEFGIHKDPIVFGKAYLKNLAQSGFIIDGALELCQYLFENFKVAIITNGIKEVQDSRLEQSPLKPYIHHMIVSDEIGIAKPDPRIFEYAMKQIGDYKKSEIIMIGDSLTSDILGGINFGVDTCWYNSDESPSIKGIKPTYVISELSELYELLK